jgi:hypothetical protein|tara:strand:+ start:118 stop:477 length:360 start_codon:yes stop_codon:yes gene_type:complete
MAYSSGKNAYGICDISGFRYKLNDMKKTWDGLLVGPDMFDPKHPQLERTRKTADPQALLNARPDVKSTISLGIVKVHNPKNSAGVSSPIMNALTSNTIGSSFSLRNATGEIGEVTITLS